MLSLIMCIVCLGWTMRSIAGTSYTLTFTPKGLLWTVVKWNFRKSDFLLIHRLTDLLVKGGPFSSFCCNRNSHRSAPGNLNWDWDNITTTLLDFSLHMYIKFAPRHQWIKAVRPLHGKFKFSKPPYKTTEFWTLKSDRCLLSTGIEKVNKCKKKWNHFSQYWYWVNQLHRISSSRVLFKFICTSSARD